LALRHVTESTRTHTRLQSVPTKVDTKKTGVVSCQNVTAKVSFQRTRRSLTSSAAHVSLSRSSIVKKPTGPNPSPFPAKPKLPQSQPRQSASANPGNSRARAVVASSAAALVSDRAYRPAAFSTSTTIFKKTSKNYKSLKIRWNFSLRSEDAENRRENHRDRTRNAATIAGRYPLYMVNALLHFKGAVNSPSAAAPP
jgi:hypothetical protein